MWFRADGHSGVHGASKPRGHTHILYIHCPHNHTHTQTHASPTNTVTQSSRTAPRRVPLQLPPLYYWSIWRLLSQGWHGLGDVTAQPINTTLKARDPQPLRVCGCACMSACTCVYMCVWVAESCSSCGWTLPFWPVYRTVITWEETSIQILLTSSTNEVQHRQIGERWGQMGSKDRRIHRQI